MRLGLGGLLVKRVKPLVKYQRFYLYKVFNSPITFPIILKLLLDIEILNKIYLFLESTIDLTYLK